MTGSGPLGAEPAGRLNFDPPSPGSALYLEPTPKRIRVQVAEETIADSRRAMLLHESGHQPIYYFPAEDVRADLLEPGEGHTRCPKKGEASYHTIRAGDRVVVNGAWYYPDPLDAAPPIEGLIAFYFNRMDRWLEEDEEIAGHPRDPYHRIDVRRSGRQIRISLEGELLAQTRRARALFETGLPTRWYLPREDVTAELAPSDTATHCPYKGDASYHSVLLASGPLAEPPSSARAHRVRRRAPGASAVAVVSRLSARAERPSGADARLIGCRAAADGGSGCRAAADHAAADDILCGVGAPCPHDRVQALGFLGGLADQAAPGDPHGAQAAGHRVRVAAAVALEGVAAAVELPPIELDDQPLGVEERVDLAPRDPDVDPRSRKAIPLAEVAEGVLELRAGRAVGVGDERGEPLCSRVARGAPEQLGQVRALEVAAAQRIVDDACERPLGQARRAVEQRSRGARHPDRLVLSQVPAPERDRAVDGDARRPAVHGDRHLEP